MKIKDRFWLWGHPEGRYNNEYGNDKISRMTPAEGCAYLGVNNVFMVPVGVDVDRRSYNKSFRRLNKVAWEIDAAGLDPTVVEQVIAEAKEFPNIGACVLDDFQTLRSDGKANLDSLWATRERMHNNEVRNLDMWMVLYTHEFGVDAEKDAQFQPFIEPFDGVIMWTWCEKWVELIPEKWEIFKKMTENKRRMFGCYLWNFGEKKEATRDAVLWQLDWYREKIIAGEAEGVVLHTNTMADLDYDAYNAALEWMAEHEEEDI